MPPGPQLACPSPPRAQSTSPSSTASAGVPRCFICAASCGCRWAALTANVFLQHPPPLDTFVPVPYSSSARPTSAKDCTGWPSPKASNTTGAGTRGEGGTTPNSGAVGGMGDAGCQCDELGQGMENSGRPTGEKQGEAQERERSRDAAGNPVPDNFWSAFNLIPCREGKIRRIPQPESILQRVVDGVSIGMDALRDSCGGQNEEEKDEIMKAINPFHWPEKCRAGRCCSKAAETRLCRKSPPSLSAQ